MSHNFRMTQEEFDELQIRARQQHGVPAPIPPQEIKFVTRVGLYETGSILKPNKYGARKTMYNGRLYDSALESRAARRLDLRVRTGELASWEPQPVVEVFCRRDGRIGWWEPPAKKKGMKPLTLDGEMLLRCRLDFKLIEPFGGVSYLEVKGFRVRDWALRHRILRVAGIPLEVEGGAPKKRAPSRNKGKAPVTPGPSVDRAPVAPTDE